MAVPSYAASWTLDPAASSLGFAVAQGGGTLEGSFGTFDAEIDLDPAALDSASIRATIDTGSASTGSAQFDGMLPNPDWFNVADFPTATFVSDSITSKGGNAYEAAGTLSIKDTSAPVTLDFTLDIDGDTAHAVGSTTLDRSNFGLGSNVGSDQVGSSVTVSFDLKASK
ncbi:MAG: YceI family protein [Rhodobacteraceae bacterium]|nr:YceI family protein [Paracoccaceae bacterium]